MSGPQFSVDGVLDALAMQRRRPDGAGRAIMFVAARGNEGATTAARTVARAAGPTQSMQSISTFAATRSRER